MDHAEVRERLADLALEPARLDALDADAASDAVALRDHLGSCPECRDELATIRRVSDSARLALDAADSESDAATPDLPVGLRARVLASTEPRKAPRPAILRLAAAAALIVALAAGGLAVDRAARADRSAFELDRLGAATAALDRVLADPDHRVLVLRAADGTPGGTLAWGAAEIVVLAPSLDRPADDRVYRCWVERAGERTSIGEMWFSGAMAWWSAPLDEWAVTLQPGDRVGISLVPPDGGEPLPVLVGEL